MNKLVSRIKRIPRITFNYNDLKKITDLEDGSLRVAVFRLIKSGAITRISKGIYTTDISKVDWEIFAVQNYEPSYLSFEWVLGKYGVLSQKPYNLTLATSRQTKIINTVHNIISYHHLQTKMYWGYVKKNGYLEADLEKAWLDLAYLSLNGYTKFDCQEMNLSLLNKNKIKKYLKKIGIKKLSNLVLSTGMI
ncbi:MAG: hypothetical protein ABH832_00960 [bacterium]